MAQPKKTGIELVKQALEEGHIVTAFLRAPARLTPEEGAQTIIYLATSPEVTGVTGRYFVKEKSIPSSKISYDLAFGRRLWALSESLTTSNGNNDSERI
ncbi:MAG: hypothetical protein K8R91_00360 [Phycisphaerae bacterium]|nr:hypothetical protein [Phycisphaerae bacterium]